MNRAIIGFTTDEVGDWVALLDCGHRQHVRHKPPLAERPWVLSAEGRAGKLGQRLDCVRCDEHELPDPFHSEAQEVEMDPSTDVLVRRLADRAAIIDVIVCIANAFDAQDWARLRSFLADELHSDYSQFRNEPPGMMRADDYVEARRVALSGVKTVHISTNHEVRLDGDLASCRSAYRIYRLAPGLAAGENRLDTAGAYEHGLARVGDGWRVTRIRQTVVIQEGNPLVHGAHPSSRQITAKRGSGT